MKKNWLFLSRAVLISVFVFLVLPYLNSGYEFVLSLVTTAEVPTSQAIKGLPYVSSPGLCPFFIFILSTPQLSIRRRIIAMLAGVAIFLGVDLLMTFVWVPYLQTPKPSLINMGGHYGYYVTAFYILPFLLWFVFAFRQIEELFRGAASVTQNNITRRAVTAVRPG